MHFIYFIRFRKYLLISIWKNLLEISLTGRNSSLELKKNKRIIIIIVFLLGVFITNGCYSRFKCNQIMELLGTALADQDISIMDALFDQESIMERAVGNYDRTYSRQRGVIEEIWNTSNYQVASYTYDLFGMSYQYWLFSSFTYTFEMTIIDSEETEYDICSMLYICRESLFDYKIERIGAVVTKHYNP